MLRQGPLPAVAHGALEYAVALLLVAAPFLFGFRSGKAVAASITLGLILLVLTATSMLPSALVKGIPVTVHVTADFGLAIVLVAIPFILGFNTEGAPTALFIVLGVLHLLVTIGTRFTADSDDSSPASTATT